VGVFLDAGSWTEGSFEGAKMGEEVVAGTWCEPCCRRRAEGETPLGRRYIDRELKEIPLAAGTSVPALFRTRTRGIARPKVTKT